MTYAYLILILWTGTMALDTSDAEWESFKTEYNRVYSSPNEEKQRKEIFIQFMEKVKSHSDNYEKGLVSYTIGINAFSDRFPEELAFGGGYKRQHNKSFKTTDFLNLDLNSELPDSVDWRKQGAVTPVKDQGLSCNSSYAFSITGVAECQNFLKSGKLVNLSEQDIVDCTFGCNGGNAYLACLKKFASRQAIDTESSYPYTGKDEKCNYNPKNAGIPLFGFDMNNYLGLEGLLQRDVALKGAASVEVDSSGDFIHYKSGIYYNKNCNPDNLNRFLLVVGYGTENGTDYWIVKNSLGEKWGMNGYILMARNKDNNCGIANNVLYVTF